LPLKQGVILKTIIFLYLFTQSLLAVSEEQLKTLQIVRDVARQIPDSHGETYENTLSAICLTESSAGRDLIGDFKKNTSITKASLGAMQIQVATAKYVANHVQSLSWLIDRTDAYIANQLVTNLKLSVQIAAHYLVILKERRGVYFNVVSGYNGGYTNHRYFAKVMHNMKLVKKWVHEDRLT
jgi:hypothetical protein